MAGELLAARKKWVCSAEESGRGGWAMGKGAGNPGEGSAATSVKLCMPEQGGSWSGCPHMSALELQSLAPAQWICSHLAEPILHSLALNWPSPRRTAVDTCHPAAMLGCLLQTEQAKQFDPEYGKEGGDDEWGDALGYMDALAGGLNLQIARTISTDQYNSLPLMSPTLSQSMLLDASIKEVREQRGGRGREGKAARDGSQVPFSLPESSVRVGSGMQAAFASCRARKGLQCGVGRWLAGLQAPPVSACMGANACSGALAGCLLQSPLTSTIDDSSMNATRHIVAVAKRAQQLLQQQQEIERQVEQR